MIIYEERKEKTRMKWEAKDEPRSEMSEDKESVSERKQRIKMKIS